MHGTDWENGTGEARRDGAVCRAKRDEAGPDRRFEREPGEETQLARANAALMGMLARGLLRPDASLASDVLDGTYAAAFAAVVDPQASPVLEAALDVLRGYGTGCAGRAVEDVRLELEIEYNRLFVGPGMLAAPPYESFYASAGPNGEGGRLRTCDENRVLEFYRTHGYDMPDRFVDLPDHLAIELDFLALLARDESEAWEAGDRERALELQAAAGEFESRHLARWVGSCADRVDSGAHLGFYPALLRIAAIMVETDAADREGPGASRDV